MNKTLGVVGLGSMGKRRVRDLRGLGHRVLGYDVRPDRREEAKALYEIDTVESFDALLARGVCALVISTPPDTHVPYYELAFEAGLPFFSEANIFTPPSAWFAEREARSGVRGVPSGTWQFHPLLGTLKERAHQGSPGAVNTVVHQYGGYLPAWHPWESYHEFYAGRWKTSAAREMVPFEAEILCWTFGPVRSVSAIRARRKEWVTPIDDTYFLLLEFCSGVQGMLSVELHQTASFRRTVVSMERGSLNLDLAEQRLEEYIAGEDVYKRYRPSGYRRQSPFAFEDVYRAEISAFVMSLDRPDAYPKSWDDDRHLSNILWAAEESARRGSWISIAEAETSYDGLAWMHEPDPVIVTP